MYVSLLCEICKEQIIVNLMEVIRHIFFNVLWLVCIKTRLHVRVSHRYVLKDGSISEKARLYCRASSTDSKLSISRDSIQWWIDAKMVACLYLLISDEEKTIKFVVFWKCNSQYAYCIHTSVFHKTFWSLTNRALLCYVVERKLSCVVGLSASSRFYIYVKCVCTDKNSEMRTKL
jgi:hypothetical protein